MKKASKEKMVRVSQAGLVALVATQLKDIALFPEKLEKDKAYLKKAKMKNS